MDVQVTTAGWQQIPIDAEQITEAVNGIEEPKFDPVYFAYNHMRWLATMGPSLKARAFI